MVCSHCYASTFKAYDVFDVIRVHLHRHTRLVIIYVKKINGRIADIHAIAMLTVHTYVSLTLRPLVFVEHY